MCLYGIIIIISENRIFLEMGSLLISTLEVDLLVILGVVKSVVKKSLDYLECVNSIGIFLPNTFLDVRRGVLCNFYENLTATGLLVVAVPVSGVDFMDFIVESLIILDFNPIIQ